LVASLLIKHGADINNNENKEHETPLHDAASNGHLHAVKLLVNSGASLQIKSAVGETVLESLQVLIRGEEASTMEPPSGFLDKRKQVEAFISPLIKKQKSKKIKIKTSKENLCKEIISKVNTSENNHKSEAFILSQMEAEDFLFIDENEEVASKNKEKTNVEPRLEQNDVITIIDSPSKNEKTNKVEPRSEQKVSIDDSQSFSNDTPFQYEIDACIEKLVDESSIKRKTILKGGSLKLNNSKGNDHKSEGPSNADFKEMYQNSATITSKEPKVVSHLSKENNSNNNSYVKSEDNISYWNDTADHKVNHNQLLEAVNSGENSESITPNVGKNVYSITHTAGRNGFISIHIESNICTTDSKTITARSAILPVKPTTNEYSMFSNGIISNSLIKSDDKVVSNKFNHRSISNTDSVLQISIHEGDQFLLIPLHNKNEMSNAGWLVDKNKTCIELVRRKVGSPLSPLRPEHNKMIQLNKKFDIFEQKHQATGNDKAGPSKSNKLQGERSTVPKISPLTKTSKTATPKKTISTPKVKQTTKSNQLKASYQQPMKRGSVKKKKQIEDQNQRKIDKWFMKSEQKEDKLTTSTDMA